MKVNETPYEHVVVDDFLDNGRYAVVEQESLRIYSKFQVEENIHLNSRKFANHKFNEYSNEAADILREMIISDILPIAEDLYGGKLLTDLEHNWGGGFHYLPQDGFLNMHIDFNIHPKTGKKRVINAILYLNEGWEPDWGGNLRLWNKGKNIKKDITPLKNRLVIFPVDSESFHGNPDPVLGDRLRKSFAIYFYVDPNAYEKVHSTIYVDESIVGLNLFYNYIWRWLKRLVPGGFISFAKKHVRIKSGGRKRR